MHLAQEWWRKFLSDLQTVPRFILPNIDILGGYGKVVFLVCTSASDDLLSECFTRDQSPRIMGSIMMMNCLHVVCSKELTCQEAAD